MKIISKSFELSKLPGNPREKTALLINPPVYDTQYWAEWSLPYGLLRIAALLKKRGYKRVKLFDFMEAAPARWASQDDPTVKRFVPKHRIHCDESYGEADAPTSKARPYIIEKDCEQLELYKYHFGKSWEELDRWLSNHGFSAKHPPTEIFIGAVMTYWWESVRDLVIRLRRRLGKRPRIILGGIYPTLCPDHAAEYIGADIVVAGEVEEANDLWTDLSLYKNKPSYSIITPSRGCPYDCSYCAQKTINGGIQKVRFRPVSDVVAEMRYKYEKYGIRDFAFYADFLLFGFEQNLKPILQELVKEKLPFRLYAPEGLDTRFLSKDESLLPLMKEAGFEKIYLPVENIDDSYLRMLNRKHVRLEHFVKAAQLCEKAGFRMRNLEVNSFALYGLPGEKIDHVVKTVLFVSEVVGSIIPMLFTPVPSTALYQQHLPYLREIMGGNERDLHKINGKLFPFLKMNEGTIEEYVDLQRLMFMLNAHYRSNSFRLFGDNMVSQSFRKNLTNEFETFVRGQTVRDITATPTQTTAEAFPGLPQGPQMPNDFNLRVLEDAALVSNRGNGNGKTHQFEKDREKGGGSFPTGPKETSETDSAS